MLEGLGIAQVALYGNSYGTYFAQVFTLRHPQRLRALVLDGAYPLDGPDYAWFPHYAPAMREKFNRACERSPECSELPGSSLEHIAPALKSLREHPFEAQARIGEGRSVRFRADASQLATVMFGSAPAYASVRDTDAAARAFVDGDQLPLLRLMAETVAGVDSRDPTHNPREFSAGLAAAVTCGDQPQIFDMTLPPMQRTAERDRLIARRQAEAPDTYAPFTIDEYRRLPLDYAFIDECVRWPARTPSWPSSTLVPDAPYPDVPVLVVSGDLDNMTSVADGAAAAARFPAAHHVVITNGFHVNALPHSRSECGAQLVRRFLTNLSTEDDSCAAQVPPVRLVPRFARHAAQLAPAQALTRQPGRRAGAARGERRAADLRGRHCARARRRRRPRRRVARRCGDRDRGAARIPSRAAPGALDAGRCGLRGTRLAGPQRHGACRASSSRAPTACAAGSSCSGPRASPAPARR